MSRPLEPIYAEATGQLCASIQVDSDAIAIRMKYPAYSAVHTDSDPKGNNRECRDLEPDLDTNPSGIPR